MSASSWIIVGAIYLAVTLALLVAARWVRTDPDDDETDLRPSRWVYFAAVFWPLFVLVALVSG